MSAAPRPPRPPSASPVDQQEESVWAERGAEAADPMKTEIMTEEQLSGMTSPKAPPSSSRGGVAPPVRSAEQGAPRAQVPSHGSADKAQKATKSLEEGRRVGRYTITKRLGAGGMAEIYLAQQSGPAGFQKTVVVKRILPELVEDPRFVEMFLREAQVAAGLNHPNVVQIFELAEDAGVYFIAMEFVEGITLYDLARQAWRLGRSLPLELIVTAIADAAQGLHYGWETTGPSGQPLRLIHRDISPDNLMINRLGATKVLDFGIAKSAESAQLTAAGELKGKLAYMSPEQVRSETMDHRSDLYALGVSMYWLVTGKHPFENPNPAAVLRSVLATPPAPPSTINPSLPPEVERWILRLLEKDPNLRPSTGLELSDGLLAMVAGTRGAISTFVVDVMDRRSAAAKATGSGTGAFIPAAPTTGSWPSFKDPNQRQPNWLKALFARLFQRSA